MIRNSKELADACAEVKAGGEAALDTEFVWKATYRPQLALVQLGDVNGKSWTIDCLLGMDVTPLAELIRDPGVVKILHDASQDLMHLRHYTGATAVNVFDTQQAAGYVRQPAKLSLQKLLMEMLGVGLAKTETMTNWMQRPLTERQLEYALDDVRYLAAARREILRRADEYDTREWLEEDMRERFADDSAYADPDPGEAWKKVKCGRIRFDRAGFARLRELARVREELACKWNLPRTWLGEDLSLAQMAADDVDDHSRLRFSHRLRNRGQHDTIATAYAEAIRSVRAMDPETYPLNPHPDYLPEVLKAADMAVAFVRDVSEQLQFDPAVVASRATITAFVDNPDDLSNPLARGWRHEYFGTIIAEEFSV